MGHLGLTPQSVLQLGGFRKQAKSATEARKLFESAQALQAAGAFAIVLESIPDDVALEATGLLDIPTIGIGAGPHCDGQVLVSHDAFGLYDGVRTQVRQAVRRSGAPDDGGRRGLCPRGP